MKTRFLEASGFKFKNKVLPAQWIESCLGFRDADVVLGTITTEIDEIDNSEFLFPCIYSVSLC